MKTQLQGLEVKSKGAVSDAEGAGQGALEGSRASVPLHGLFRGNILSLASSAADSLMNPVTLCHRMER